VGFFFFGGLGELGVCLLSGCGVWGVPFFCWAFGPYLVRRCVFAGV